MILTLLLHTSTTLLLVVLYLDYLPESFTGGQKMFGTMLNEKLNHWFFWLFFIGFHLTFFIQHFLGLMGMPRRYWIFLEDQGLDLFNFISTIGAFFMAAGTILFLINVVITQAKGVKVSGDPWDARTLEWAIPSPPPFYNFQQEPLVRG